MVVNWDEKKQVIGFDKKISEPHPTIGSEYFIYNLIGNECEDRWAWYIKIKISETVVLSAAPTAP